RLIERRTEGDKTIAADAAIARLERGDPAQRAGPTDAAAGVGAERASREIRSDRRRAAAAAAAGDAFEVPRVARDLIAGVFGGGAHRKLVHVELAEHDHASFGQFADDGGIENGHIAFEDLRRAGGFHVFGRDHILDAERHAE